MPAINFIFLEEEDLQTQMFEAYIDNDDAEDVAAIEKIERQQIAVFKTKMRLRYVVDTVFTQTGTTRNPEIVKHLSAMVCYYMIRRNAARKVPSDYEKEMDLATKWLNDVRDGNEVPDLPVLESHTELRHGNSRNDDYLV